MRHLRIILAAVLALGVTTANADPITFDALTGSTAQNTGVFRADLSGLSISSLASITMTDDSGNAGSPGVWSGFDLDSIKLSTTFCATAACAAGAAGLDVFDFLADVIFSAGTMDATGNAQLQGACLFGTSGGGCDFDDAIATLGAFDGFFNGNNVQAGSGGFLSIGRGGEISFNLTDIVDLTGDPIYLYVGETGNNGEMIAGMVTVSDEQVSVPEPGTLGLLGLGLLGLGMARRRRQA